MISLEKIKNAYDGFGREIFAFIFKYTGDTETSEDILHDVFTRLIEYSHKKNVNDSNIRALLYRMARNICIDYSRKSSSKNINCDHETLDAAEYRKDSSEKDDSSAVLEILNELTDMLKEPEKSILILKKAGMTFREISQLLKIPERTLKRKMKKITEELKIKFQNKGFFK
ncbi:MAG: sigma-70 family RNA polymerase sigma factor [Spirochaetes bacterium]|nr:sigma-70 family RNA polymerase sigma factor [Spirochaetota bacterium]